MKNVHFVRLACTGSGIRMFQMKAEVGYKMMTIVGFGCVKIDGCKMPDAHYVSHYK